MWGAGVGMLLGHVGGRTAGRWATMREDGRGQFVRGKGPVDKMGGATALSMISAGGLDGLSNCFVAGVGCRGLCGGRDLKESELREILLVSAPMLPGARIAVTGAPIKIRVSCRS